MFTVPRPSGRVGSLPSSMPSSAPFASPASCRQQAAQQQQQQQLSGAGHNHARSFDAGGGMGSMDDVDSNASITRAVETAASASAASSAASVSAAGSALALPSVTDSPPGKCTSDRRLAKDLQELQASKFTAQASTRISFPDGRQNLRQLLVLVTPHSGLYAHASFRFMVSIPPAYPFQPPRVTCLTPVLHPNIDWRKGRVYLHLLQEEWKPVLSINAVIFALQLLFLEPWPQTQSGGLVSAELLSSGHTHGALSLASSKSAAACSAQQLSSADAVLCPEVRALILQAGGKHEFEAMVRRTLEGGFVFGRQWTRNHTDPDSDCSGGDDDDDEHAARVRLEAGGGQMHFAGMEDRDLATPFETMLARVEQNGRQACVNDVQVTPKLSRHSDRRASPYPPASVHPHIRVKRRDHITPIAELDADGDDTLADCAASSAAAESALPPSRGAGHRRTAKIRGDFSDTLAAAAAAVAAGSSPSSSPSKRILLRGSAHTSPSLLHSKRSHRRMERSSPHAHNPAADLAESRPSFQRVADGTEADSLHSHKRVRSAPAAAVLLAARSNTTNHRVVKLRSFDTPLSAAASSSASSASASAAASVADGGARCSRKRPSPSPPQQSHSASLSDGEYEQIEAGDSEADAEGDVNLSAASASPQPTTAHDDLSPAASVVQMQRRLLRRSKKQFLPGSIHAPASAGLDELELASLMHGPSHSSASFLRLHEPQQLPLSLQPPRPPSTVLPDLASFASFRPTGNPVFSAAGSSYSSSSTSSSSSSQLVAAASSSSPKRNASDCSGIAIVPAAPLDLAGARYGLRASDEAASSFILSGRSSSRSLNMFGSSSKPVGPSGPGLSNLQDLHASLAAATMADV